LKGRYAVGERYGIQPAVMHSPINHPERYADAGRGVDRLGVGYTLGGCLAEYLLITEEVLEADCLVRLPSSDLAHAHVALGEPLSCVISAQEHHFHLVQDSPLARRRGMVGLQPGDLTVIVGAGAMGCMHVDLALASKLSALLVVDLVDERLQRVQSLFGGRAAASGTALHVANPSRGDVGAMVDELTDQGGAADVIVAAGSRAAIEQAQHWVGRGGVLNLFGGLKRGEDLVALDAGIIHYRETVVTGSTGGSPGDLAAALAYMAAGEIDAAAHVGMVGDLTHAVAFIQMLRRREMVGKAMVYPHRRSERMLAVKRWDAADEAAYLAVRNPA
jgi:L-iditol 2-dehydrogenase